MSIPSYDRRKAALDAGAHEFLDVPLDLSKRGLDKWFVGIRMKLREYPAGSPDRKAFIDAAVRNFGYVSFLLRRRRPLVALLDEQKRQLPDLIDSEL